MGECTWKGMKQRHLWPLSNFVFVPSCTDIFEFFWQAYTHVSSVLHVQSNRKIAAKFSYQKKKRELQYVTSLCLCLET